MASSTTLLAALVVAGPAGAQELRFMSQQDGSSATPGTRRSTGSRRRTKALPW
jgi:hypothetical protein